MHSITKHPFSLCVSQNTCSHCFDSSSWAPPLCNDKIDSCVCLCFGCVLFTSLPPPIGKESWLLCSVFLCLIAFWMQRCTVVWRFPCNLCSVVSAHCFSYWVIYYMSGDLVRCLRWSQKAMRFNSPLDKYIGTTPPTSNPNLTNDIETSQLHHAPLDQNTMR